MLSWGNHLSTGQRLLVLCHSSPTRLVHSLTCLAPTDNWICSPESKTHGPPHGHLLQVSPDGGWSEPKCYRGDQPSEREKYIKLKLHSNDFISRNWNRGMIRHPHASFNTYLLDAYHVPGIVWGAGEAMETRLDPSPYKASLLLWDRQ